MTKFGMIGAAAVNFPLLASPVMAGHVISGAAGQPHESIYCATREPGNPHSKYCDYLAWSKWRQRGDWDASLDNACLQNPAYIPGECGFAQQGRLPFAAPMR